MYNTKEGKSCVIYIRVSSERQVKGYSLDGQKHYLAECAERRGMTVLDTYVEEGKSGKSIEGRTEFQRMLDDIQSGKVHTDYVLVFKLSRFGRNARDVLNSLEFIMKYGVHLMCVEDGLDSSTSMGKMMITILGAVAELERENIIAQSLLGREEKAKSGGWNGGFAPYGYRLVKGDDKSKGKLETVPEEKAVVQLVFDMFLNRNMGYTAISGYLNRNGYTRPPAKNAIRPSYGEWSSDHIKRMLSNPVYTGRVAWGKRRTEKVPGKDNEYRLVKQDEYILSEVISHEAFVSKEDFDKVQEIKAIRGKKGNHNIGQYNAHLLSGIVKCPQCGAPMYIGMTKWTNQDGTERRTESYVCSYATKHRGTSVCRRNGVVASQVEDEVMEYTRKIVRNPQFIKDLQEKVMTAVDMTEVENDITAYKNQLSALQRSRDSLERDIDRIAPDDKYAERRRADMTRRLNDLYDQIYKAEDLLQESMMKKATLESEQMSVQSMIGILSSFDAIYDRMNAAERRDLVKYLISEVELFPREEQKTQKRFVKAIAYKFPIEQKVLTQFDECGASVETVVQLVKKMMPIIESEEGVKNLVIVEGVSMTLGNGENVAMGVIGLKPWDQRTRKDLYSTAILNKLRQKFAQIPEAEFQLFEMPAIPGLGLSGGLDFKIQSLDDLDYNALDGNANSVIETVMTNPDFMYGYSSFTSKTPNLYLDIDRMKAESMNVPMANIFSALESYLGSGYVNDVNFGTQVNKVIIQSDWKYRRNLKSLDKLYVPNAYGKMVPLKALVSVKQILSPRQITRYNQYPAAGLTVMQSGEVSSGEAMNQLEALAKQVLPKNYAYEWSGMSYQEKQNQGQISWVIGLAVLFAYLFLVAQYESWIVPISVLMSVIFAIAGGLLGLWITGLPLSIYAQLGLVLLIGLSAKSCILIVEFAKDEYNQGTDAITASLHGLTQRFRAVLMTAFTFVLGVMPMIWATGAASGSRRSLGTPVFWGMMVGTVLALAFTPLFYVLIQRLVEKFYPHALKSPKK